MQIAALANSETGSMPAHAPFDWSTLAGTYRYAACENSGAPLWAIDPGHRYLELSSDPWHNGLPQKDSLTLVLYRDAGTTIALNWDFDHINQGEIHGKNAETGTGVRVSETFTVSHGIFNSLRWDYPKNRGQATLLLLQDGRGGLTYEMSIQRGSSPIGSERCRLIRYPSSLFHEGA